MIAQQVIDSILELIDFPDSFSGQANKILAVKATEDGIEFVTSSGGVSVSGTPAANQLAIWNTASQIKGLSSLTFNGTTLQNTASATSQSTLRVGTLEFQPYSVNNAWFGDNVYYSGGFQRRTTGAAGLFYFQGNEGQFRFYNSGSGSLGSGVGNVCQLKISTANGGTVAIGGASSNAGGTFTGATLIVDGTYVTITNIPTSNPGGTGRIWSDSGTLKIT